MGLLQDDTTDTRRKGRPVSGGTSVH
jgi:hypothetical protein